MPKWVGDLVLATPALRALRQRFAQAHIAFLVRGQLADVLDGGDWMDEVIHWPTAKTRPNRRKGMLGLAAELRERQFDCAVLFTNSFRSALLARLAGIERRVGYDRDGRGMLLTDRLLPAREKGKFIPVPMVRYYNAIARYMGAREVEESCTLFVTAAEETVAADALAAAGVSDGRPIILINPGASFGPAKCWLPERFAEVADALGNELKAAVLVACGPDETRIAREVAHRMRYPVTVLDNPVMRLGPLKALVRRAALVITNDTGPRHFAAALGTLAVTLFGPTDPQWTACDNPRERSVMVSVNCGPCMKRKCPVDHRCMTRITSDMVLEQARELLNGSQEAAKAV